MKGLRTSYVEFLLAKFMHLIHVLPYFIRTHDEINIGTAQEPTLTFYVTSRLPHCHTSLSKITTPAKHHMGASRSPSPSPICFFRSVGSHILHKNAGQVILDYCINFFLTIMKLSFIIKRSETLGQVAQSSRGCPIIPITWKISLLMAGVVGLDDL